MRRNKIRYDLSTGKKLKGVVFKDLGICMIQTPEDDVLYSFNLILLPQLFVLGEKLVDDKNSVETFDLLETRRDLDVVLDSDGTLDILYDGGKIEGAEKDKILEYFIETAKIGKEPPIGIREGSPMLIWWYLVAFIGAIILFLYLNSPGIFGSHANIVVGISLIIDGFLLIIMMLVDV